MTDHIVIDPQIQHGKPVIRGTRVPVARIVGGLAGGMSFQEVQDDYGVSMEDIRAALEFANELVGQEDSTGKDSLVDDLLQSNAAFRDLVAKSKASSRRLFRFD